MNTLDPKGILKTEAERQVAQTIANKLQPLSLPEALSRRRELLSKREKIEADLRHFDGRSKEAGIILEELTQLETWFKKPPALILERNECSRLHRLKEAAKNYRIIDDTQKIKGAPFLDCSPILCLEHPFVINHDWARAFENAQDITGDFRLPYPQCAFEFRVDGHSVILWVAETQHVAISLFIEMHDYWYQTTDAKNRDDPMAHFLWRQVRAVCIAIDAEVAMHSVVRAPHKLNAKRVRDGKAPVADFHVVDLAKRHRVANPSAGAGEGSKKRLHFRRGHWRHFETSKTWVKWCLVGDPDLGFIQKSYKL